jgi:hypothetical protein
MLTTYQFKGRDLYPFSTARKDALLAICPGLIPSSAGEPTRAGPFELKAIVFLCASSYTVCQRAFSNPDQLRVKILEWIDTEASTEDAVQEVMDVAVKIMQGAEKHRVVPKPDGTTPDVEDTDPNS